MIPSPVHKIEDPLLDHFGLTLFVKRDDLIHPFISGNKWRKLKYNLSEKAPGFATCGGAYSNHIYAFAAAIKLNGLKGMVFVRGDYDPSNPTTRFVESCAIPIQYIPRDAFRIAHANGFFDWRQQFCPDYAWIPEGGSNALALPGVKELAVEMTDQLAGSINTIWILATATGGTLAGLVAPAPEHVFVQGISVLKNYGPTDLVKTLIPLDSQNTKWECVISEAYGGYAKWTEALLGRIQDAWEKYQIPLDPVYTGKAWDIMWQKIENGEYAEGARLVFVHTGGLQGIRGFNQRFDNKLMFLEAAIPEDGTGVYFKA